MKENEWFFITLRRNDREKGERKYKKRMDNKTGVNDKYRSYKEINIEKSKAIILKEFTKEEEM